MSARAECPVIEKKLPKEVVEEVFKTIRCVSKGDDEPTFIFHPKNYVDGYMWNAQEGKIKSCDLDDIDRRFLLGESIFKLTRFIAYHDYAGYHGLFKPDLEEVINLIYDWWVKEGKPQRLYVRTRPYPDNTIAAYNSQLDRHYGQTWVWYETEPLTTHVMSQEPVITSIPRQRPEGEDTPKKESSGKRVKVESTDPTSAEDRDRSHGFE